MKPKFSKLQNKFLKSALLLSAVAFAACQGTLKDPKTISKSDLNPPFRLMSTTTNNGFILQWNITNTEDDLKGFNVYLIDKPLTEVQKVLNSGTSTKIDLQTQQIRRCDKTKELFALFGFKPVDKFANKSCDDFDEKNEQTSSNSASMSNLASTEPEEKPTFVKCLKDNFKTALSGDGLTSVDISAAVDMSGQAIPTDLKSRVGRTLRCELGADTVLSNGTKGIQNGKEYTAFVTAVQGDKGAKISYTSNFVSDVPTETVVSETILKSGTFGTTNLFVNTSVKEAKDAQGNSHIAGNWTMPGANDIGGRCPDYSAANITGCQIDRETLLVANSQFNFPRLIMSEDSQPESDRVFIAGEKDKVFLIKREGREAINGKPGIFKAGDSPLSFALNREQFVTGRNLSVLPGDLFDFVVIDGNNKHYGKIYFETLEVKTGADKVGNQDKFVRSYIALQTLPDSLFYAISKLNLGK